jgi:hypothetical protein
MGAAPMLSSTILRRGETGDVSGFVVGPQGPTVFLFGFSPHPLEPLRVRPYFLKASAAAMARPPGKQH